MSEIEKFSSDAVRAIFAQSLSRVVEAYDLYVISVLAPILATVFLPPETPPLIRAFETVFTLSVTLVFRPVGAAVFGNLTDTIGRKNTLLITLSCFGVASGVCALLPTYASVGYLSFGIFLLMRAIAGMMYGGEYAAGDPYALEWSPRKWRGLVSGILNASLIFGFFLISLVSSVFYGKFGESGMASFGWRYIFATSLIPIPVALIIRIFIRESPLFEGIRSRGLVEKHPFFSLFKGRELHNFLSVFVLSTGIGLAFFTYTGLFTTMMTTAPASLSRSAATDLLTIITAIITVGTFVSGAISQYVGRRRLGLILAVVYAIIAFPAIYGTVHQVQSSFLISALLGTIAGVLVDAPFGFLHAYYSERFRTSHRGSGYGFGYLSGYFLGGIFPVYVSFLHPLFAGIEGPNIWFTISLVTVIGMILMGIGFYIGPETVDVDLAKVEV